MDNNIIINPVKTGRMTSGTMQTPNFMGSFGEERRMSSMIENAGYRLAEIRDNNQILLGESYITEQIKRATEFEAKMTTDSSYFSSDKQLEEFLKLTDEDTKNYEQTVANNGYDSDFMNAYKEKAQKIIAGSKNRYIAAYMEHQNEIQKQDFLLIQDSNTKNISRLMVTGNYKDALDLSKNVIGMNLAAAQRGYIKLDKAISENNKLVDVLTIGDLDAWVNKENAIEYFNELEGYTFDEYVERYKEIEGSVGGYDIMLTQENYETWRKHISAAKTKAETRQNAIKQKTMYQVTQEIQYRKNNNFAIESKKYPSSITPNEVGETLYVDSTNNYYGTTFKDWREPIQLGYQFKLLDDSNSQEKFYNDVGISGVELINKNIEEYQAYAGGKEEEFARATRDGMAIDYHSRGVKTAYGYNVNKQLQNAGSETSNLLVRTYTPESRQVLDKVDKVNLNFTGNFEKFKEYKATFKTGRPISSMAQPIPYGATAQMNAKEPEWEVLIGEEFENNKYTDLSIIGIIEGLEYTAIKGDVNSKATSQDLTNIASDVFKLMAIEKMSGILPEDIADDLNMKASAGMFITDLTLAEKNKVFNYILREDDELKEEFVKIFEPVAKEILGDTQIGTLTNGRFVRLNGVSNVSKEVRGLDDYMENNDFIAIVGKNSDGTDKTKIVKGKELVPISTSDGKQILITYNGNPVILNNAVAVYEVGGIE